jgi:tetratricopeptide (TPR) repeat protein
MAELARWLREKAQTRKQRISVLGLYVRILRYAPEDVSTRQKAAELAMNLGDWAVALDNLDVLLARRPDDAELCEDYGFCLQVIGKYDESARWYERAVRADSKRVSAYVHHAAVLHQGLRQPDQALARVEEACRANPTSGFAHAARAQYLRMFGRLKDAAEAIDLARKFPSDNDRDQQWMIEIAADIEQSAGNYAVARKLLEDGARKYPKNSRFGVGLAQQFMFDGRTDLAIATLREARDKNVRDKTPPDADVLTLLGDLLAQDGQVGPLEEALRQLNEINAPADRVQYVQARLLLRRGRWAEAAALLDKLRMVSLRTPYLYRQSNLLLAQCYEQLGDSAGELEAYRRLLESDPNAGTVRLDFAKALARAGRSDEAVSQFLSVVPRAEVNSRAVAEAARMLYDRLRADAKVWTKLEKAVDALKVENNNSNPALARAYLDLARHRPADSIAMIDGLVRANPRSPALHAVRAQLAEQVFGLDRALKALADAEVVAGDQPDLRVVRARLLAARLDPTFADGLAALGRGIDRFGAEDRARILREVVAAFRTLEDDAAVGLHLDLLAQLRPDLLSVREALYARALKAGDEARCRAVLREVEGIEGADGPTLRLLEALRLLWLAQPGDTTTLAKVTDQLVAADRGRPHDPIVEFLRGRVDELAGRPTDALHHYQAAFAAGLADRPVEDLFVNLPGKTGNAPVSVLRDQLPLADRLLPDRHRSLIVAVLPLYDSAGMVSLTSRLIAAVPPADSVSHAWLGRLFARHNLSGPAEQCFGLAAADAPQSPEGWLALVSFQTARGNDAGVTTAAAQVRDKMAPIDAHLVVGQAFESARRFDAAQKEYENAAALNPNDTRPLKYLATLALTRGQTDDACRRLEQIVALTAPTAPEDQVWARRTLVRQLAMTPSSAAFSRALTVLDQNKTGDQPADDDQRIRVQVLAAQKSRPLPGTQTTARREAIRILEDLRKRGSARSADDLIFLAGLYRSEGDEAGSRQARARMASEYPTHFGCTVFLAREALRDHDLPACEALLPALRRLGPGQFDGLAVEFQYRVLTGAPDLGRRALEGYIAAATTAEDRTARTIRCANLIFDFLQLHTADERGPVVADLRATAIRLYRPVAERNGEAFQRLVTLLSSQSDGADPAIDLIQRVKRVFGPEAAAAAYVQVMRSGKPDAGQREAIKRFIEYAMESDPQSTPLQLTWAEYLQLTGKVPDAVAVYREILRREPDNVLVLNNLAWTLDRRDEAAVRESLSYIQRAIDLAGPLDELLDTRSRILFESGSRDAALRDMSDAVNQAPSAARLTDYAQMLQKAGKNADAERALAAAKQFTSKAP